MTNEGKTDEGGGGGSPWNELKRLGDEVRVKLHLMNMEVKQRWAEVEPKLQAVQAKVEAKTDQAAGAVQEQVLAVIDGLRTMLDELRADIDGSKRTSQAEPAAPAGASAVEGAGDAAKDPGPGDHPA